MKEYICKYCGEKFSKPTDVGGHVLKIHRDKNTNGSFKRKKEREIEYNKNPKLCKFCKKQISYNKRINDFCSKSCAAKLNNVGIDRWEKKWRDKSGAFTNKKENKIETKDRIKKVFICLNCGKNSIDKYFSENRKYCSLSCQHEYASKEKIRLWLETNNKNENSRSSSIKKYLLEEQKYCCAICGIENKWNNKELLLIVDHIDGNSLNNCRENLRLICSNCDSQLPTYKGRNKGSGRFYRKERYRQGKSY